MMIVDGLQSLAQRLAVTFAVASMFIACCEAQTKQVHIKIDGAEKTCDVTPQFNGRMLQVTCDDVPQGMANVDKNGYVSIAGTNHNTPVEGKIVRLAATEYLHPTDGTAPPVAEPTPAETAAAAMSAQMEAARLTAAQRAQRTTGGGFGVGQGLDQLSNAVAGIVASREGAVAQNGTGFVVSVDRSTVTVLTARHLFYREGERERFEGNGTVTVTFFADRHQDYPAKLLEDSDSLDLAVLKVENVPPSISAKLPLIPVRPNSAPPSIADTGLRIFGGKEVGWQVANGAVSGGDKSAEGFQYMAPTAAGFSGSPVFDSKGLLLGVHLRTSDQSGIGRATRIDGNVYKVLNGSLGVTMNRLNFNVVPGDDAGQNTIEEMRARTAGFTEGFGRIDAHARKVGKWELTIWAWGRSVSSNYYDVRLEAILKGVGNGSQSVRVSDLRLAGQPHKYTAQVDELGKSAVVCFTGTPNMASPRPQRLTAWFSIDVNGSVATFSPSRPAALEPASENPCDPDPTAPVESTAKMVRVQQAAPEQGLPNAAPPRPSGRQADAVDMDPANFAAIQVVASLRQQKWSLTVNALSGGLRQRDTSLQVMVLDATDHLKALPLSKKTLAGATYTNELIDELGKGVVVCYTAIDDSAKGQAFRMTSWFATEVQGNRAKFVPVRPAVITRASDAPCQ